MRSLGVALLATLAATALPAPAVAADWHYLVVEVDRLGRLEPVFHTRCDLAAPRASLSEAEAAAARAGRRRGQESVEVELLAGGEVAFRDVVAVERFVHVEAADATGALDRVDVELDRAAAAVRVPAVVGGTLILRGDTEVWLDLDRIDQAATVFRLAGWRPASVRSSLGSTRNPANRLDLLIMGDGYTAAQEVDFAADAAALSSAFLSISPYSTYSNFVAFSTLFTASTESGADHPPYSAGCSGDDRSCCSDPVALNDPLAGTYRATAFDARYCSYMIHRLLVTDAAKVLAAAAAAPDWDKIFVVVNDSTYGGSGGYIAVASTNPSAPDVMRHEFGHSFSGLADEYESAYPGYPPCSDITGPACEPNVTDQTVRAAVKWEPWIHPSVPVPTPEGAGYYGDVGLFEGARYLASGMYRPREWHCLMRGLGRPFCEVCAQTFVLTLYNGGWGVPAAGIDPIEPGSEIPPVGTVPFSGSQVFSVDVLSPAGGPAATVEWRVDDVVQVGQTGASFTFAPLASGAYAVEVRVADGTPLVHPEMAGTSLTSSRQWTAVETSEIFADGFESGSTAAWDGTVP